ncbi:MAG: discoidin domain-containing protein, partial [Deltaproteobacteria bacterium]
MRLDFDFKGGGGFVVARKRFSFPLPDAYAFTLDVHGVAPANKFEFKLVDPGGQNVWRYQAEAFDLPAEWRSLRIGSSQIDFAWGPAGSGPMRQVGAIEFAITAPPGGKGTLWIANLCLEDHSFRSTPAVQASSALPGHEPRCAVDRCLETSWRSEPSDEPQWFLVDFGEVREYGGLIVRWDPTTTARPFDLESSDDGTAWKTVYSAKRPDAARSYVYLPHGTSRRLRLRLHGGVDGKGIGIAEIDVKPYEFSRSLNAFFGNIAANEPRGLFPRYLSGEQTYWTPVGSVLGGVTQGLLNEDGMLEVDRGTFSLEPFLYVGEELVTWADGSPTQELEQGFLPIPSSVWRKDGIALKSTAFATGEAGKAVLYMRYRLENLETEPRRVRFFAAVRPFQVTPPWQAFNDLGGVSAITTLEYVRGAVWVNRRKAVIPLTPPSGFGVAAFAQAPVTEYLLAGDLPPEDAVSDGFGYASGALRYDLDLLPGFARDVYLATPFGAADPALAPSFRDFDGA